MIMGADAYSGKTTTEIFEPLVKRCVDVTQLNLRGGSDGTKDMWPESVDSGDWYKRQWQGTAIAYSDDGTALHIAHVPPTGQTIRLADGTFELRVSKDGSDSAHWLKRSDFLDSIIGGRHAQQSADLSAADVQKIVSALASIPDDSVSIFTGRNSAAACFDFAQKAIGRQQDKWCCPFATLVPPCKFPEKCQRCTKNPGMPPRSLGSERADERR